jgi:SAM-dependent methyltransferase
MLQGPTLYLNKAPDYLRPFDPYISQYLQILTPVLNRESRVMILGGNLGTLAVQLARTTGALVYLVLGDGDFAGLTGALMDRNSLSDAVQTLHPEKDAGVLEALRGTIDVLAVEPPMANVFLVPGWWKSLARFAEFMRPGGMVFPRMFSLSLCLSSMATMPAAPGDPEVLAARYSEKFDVDLAPIIEEFHRNLYPQFVKALPAKDDVMGPVKTVHFTLDDVIKGNSVTCTLEAGKDGEVACLFLQFLFKENESRVITSALSGPFQNVELLFPAKVAVKKGDEINLRIVLSTEDLLTVECGIPDRTWRCELPAVSDRLHFSLLDHLSMLWDIERTAAFDHALKSAVSGGKSVLDLGCGTGILSVLALKAGASRVVGVERDSRMISLAEAFAKANDYCGRFVGRLGDSRDVALDEKVDVIVTETLGDKIFNEGILESVTDARVRFLKEGGLIIPGRIEVFLFATETGKYAGPTMHSFSANLEKEIGLDLSLYRNELRSLLSVEMQRYNTSRDLVLTEVTPFAVFDLSALGEREIFFDRTVTLKMGGSGELNSLWAFFMAYLSEDQAVTNFPPQGMTHWRLVRFFDFPARAVREGDEVAVRLWYDGEFKMTLLEAVEADLSGG